MIGAIKSTKRFGVSDPVSESVLNNYCQIVRRQCCKVKKNNRGENEGTQCVGCNQVRVAEVGSFSVRTKRAIKIFVRRVFDIFATDPSFLCVIAKSFKKCLNRDKS